MPGLLSLQDECMLVAQLLSLQDRLSLAGTCRHLRQASQHWFPEVEVCVKPSQRHRTEALAAWLHRHKAAVHLQLDGGSGACGRAAIRALLLPLSSAAGSQGALGVVSLSASSNTVLSVPTDALSGLTALTRLELPISDLVGSLKHLAPLAGSLRHLRFMGCQLAPASWRHLGCLAVLESLRLEDIPTDGLAQLVAAALPSLARLTSLALSASASTGLPAGSDHSSSTAAPSWECLAALTALQLIDLRSVPAAADVPRHLAAAPHLQALLLPMCRLEEVPPAVSALTKLTGVHLGDNSQLKAGLQHLAPLTQLCALRLDGCRSLPAGEWRLLEPLGASLRHLSIEGCGLAALPGALSSLAALTGLCLGYNDLGSEAGAASWRHLAALTQLRELDVRDCELAEVPESLSSLVSLLSLGLGGNVGLSAAQGWCHLEPLSQLQLLDVFGCDLHRLPSSLSALVSLTGLICSFNPGLARGSSSSGNGGSENSSGDGGGSGRWGCLQPLTALLHLDCHGCGLAGVPAALAALPELTCVL